MINCVAIDDEPIALSIIEEHCRRHGGIRLRTFTSPVEGMECVRESRPDILFMDIEMNSHNGVELAKEVPAETSLVFTTAYSHYAIDGFEADAADFLHKPIFYQRFCRAVDKALKWRGVPQEGGQASPGAITLRVEHKNVVVRFDDILLVEAMDNYVKVYRRDMPMVMSQITMWEMESILPPEDFIRVHRSFIIPVKGIIQFSYRKLSLDGIDRTVPVGRKYIDSFREFKLAVRGPKTSKGESSHEDDTLNML